MLSGWYFSGWCVGRGPIHILQNSGRLVNAWLLTSCGFGRDDLGGTHWLNLVRYPPWQLHTALKPGGDDQGTNSRRFIGERRTLPLF